jgi:hypothetical protein
MATTDEERFDRIDANIGELKESVGELRDSVRNLTQYVLDFREEAARRFEVLDNRLDMMVANMSNMVRFPPLTKAILEFGKTATQLTNGHFANKQGTAELADRVGRLEEKTSKIVNPAA